MDILSYVMAKSSSKGADGIGISSIVKTSTSGLEDTYTITFTNNTTTTFVVTNGAKGADGAKGDKGDKGDKGADGAKGTDGANGTDGYTPVRGTDYWTAQDQEYIVETVLSRLPTAEGGEY